MDKNTRELTERLVPSEAHEAVRRMLRAYPNKQLADDFYLSEVAKIFLKFPRCVALDCADPQKGVALETKFLPTMAEINKWCQKAARPLIDEFNRKKRIEAQIDEREKWQGSGRSPGLMEKTKAWLERKDPVVRQLMGDETSERGTGRSSNADQAHWTLSPPELEGSGPPDGGRDGTPASDPL